MPHWKSHPKGPQYITYNYSKQLICFPSQPGPLPALPMLMKGTNTNHVVKQAGNVDSF